MPAPYGFHPCESTRMPGHGWRFPPRSMNHRNSMPFRPPFEDAIPVANRGASPLHNFSSIMRIFSLDDLFGPFEFSGYY